MIGQGGGARDQIKEGDHGSGLGGGPVGSSKTEEVR